MHINLKWWNTFELKRLLRLKFWDLKPQCKQLQSDMSAIITQMTSLRALLDYNVELVDTRKIFKASF